MVSRRSRIFLKMENLQPSGSFKSRGLGNLVLRSYRASAHPEKLHYFSASGGNAGLGCVYAAKFVGRPSTVVVPVTTKEHMIEKILAAGASEVLQYGANIKEAGEYLESVIMPQARERGEEPIYIMPFDHEDIWDGHSSIVDEIQEQLEETGDDAPEWVVCSCGGGGLFNGIMQGIGRQGYDWNRTRVLAVETEGSDSLAAALEKDEHIALPGITSIATSLGCVKVSQRTFELAKEGRRTGRSKNIVLSDAEAAMGCWRLAEDERIMVEAACGVNIALCYGKRLEKAIGRAVGPEDKIVIVLCGGSNVTTDMIEGWKEDYAHLVEPELVDKRKSASSSPKAPSSPKREVAKPAAVITDPSQSSGYSSDGEKWLTNDSSTSSHLSDYLEGRWGHLSSGAVKRPNNVIIC